MQFTLEGGQREIIPRKRGANRVKTPAKRHLSFRSREQTPIVFSWGGLWTVDCEVGNRGAERGWKARSMIDCKG